MTRNHRPWPVRIVVVTALPLSLGASLVLDRSGSGRAPQNGNGRNTDSAQPRKKAASSRIKAAGPTANVESLAGTVWNYTSQKSGIEFAYEFLSGGKLKMTLAHTQSSLYATWTQQGRRVTIKEALAHGTAISNGTISGNRMNGTTRYESQTTRWSAVKVQE